MSARFVNGSRSRPTYISSSRLTGDYWRLSGGRLVPRRGIGPSSRGSNPSISSYTHGRRRRPNARLRGATLSWNPGDAEPCPHIPRRSPSSRRAPLREPLPWRHSDHAGRQRRTRPWPRLQAPRPSQLRIDTVVAICAIGTTGCWKKATATWASGASPTGAHAKPAE